MTTPERRQVLYSKMFHFMKCHKVITVPVQLDEVCASAGIELVPLSEIVRGTGLPENAVFSIWGNTDGAVNCYQNRYRIAYNDNQPSGRIRFTISEEIAHIVYGHVNDPAFSLFRQDYSNEKYAQYDEEARLGAGFLVCPPKFFYSYDKVLKPEHLSRLCGISLPCAEARHDIFTKYKSEITSNLAYQFSAIPQSSLNIRKVVGF